jgi:Spy/CpxP family protein refolding chaperone
MSMMARGGILAVMIIAVMTTAIAHGARNGPTGRWWRQPKVVAQLKLTDGEIGKLEAAFEASRLKMIKLKSKVEAEQFKLQNLVEKRNINEKAIKSQHRKLEAARSALAEEQLAFFVKVRKIIGYDRYRKLEAMQRNK